MPASDNFAFGLTPIEKVAGDIYDVDSDPIAFNFTNILPSGVTVSSVVGTIAVDKETTPALEFSDAEVNASEYEDDDGVTVAANRAVLASCTGGEVGNYIATVTALLSNGSTRSGKFRIHVR